MLVLSDTNVAFLDPTPGISPDIRIGSSWVCPKHQPERNHHSPRDHFTFGYHADTSINGDEYVGHDRCAYTQRNTGDYPVTVDNTGLDHNKGNNHDHDDESHNNDPCACHDNSPTPRLRLRRLLRSQL